MAIEASSSPLAAPPIRSLTKSFEPGEDWFYDYRTDDFVVGPELAPPHSHPVEQGVPGPVGRVPEDWERRLG